MSMTATHSEVLARAMQIGKEAEAARDLKMVRSIISQAGKGAGAEIGLENTLQRSFPEPGANPGGNRRLPAISAPLYRLRAPDPAQQSAMQRMRQQDRPG